jgi:MFS family permease
MRVFFPSAVVCYLVRLISQCSACLSRTPIVFTASTFMQVILMQRLLDYTPMQAGLALLPGSLALSLGFPLAGRVADRFDHYVIMLCALSVFALSSYLFTFLSLEWPVSWIVWLVALRFSSGTAAGAAPSRTAGNRRGLPGLLHAGYAPVSRQYATAVTYAQATCVSCEQSGVLVTDVQAQHVYWLPLTNRQKPDAYGANPVDAWSTSLLHVLP